jgi:hypothetical protein
MCMGFNSSGARWLIRVLFVTLILAGVLTGCASTRQARDTNMAGFLGDYSQLKPGAEGEALLLYIDPAANISGYNAILMDPIRVYAKGKDSPLSKVPLAELLELINYFDATIREHLAADYAFVTQPGPGTMRLRVAITEAKGAKVGLSAVSSVTPAGIALNGLKMAVSGASTGVGSTGVEMELLDAQSGKRLAAAVDKRVGSKTSSFGKWQSAKEAFDYWAEKLRLRLMEFRTK